MSKQFILALKRCTPVPGCGGTSRKTQCATTSKQHVTCKLPTTKFYPTYTLPERKYERSGCEEIRRCVLSNWGWLIVCIIYQKLLCIFLSFANISNICSGNGHNLLSIVTLVVRDGTNYMMNVIKVSFTYIFLRKNCYSK